MGIEKLVPISGFIKSWKEAKAYRNRPDNFETDWEFGFRELRTFGLGILNIAYAMGAYYYMLS